MGPKKNTKERDESFGKRSSSRLAERARLEKLRAQRATRGGDLLGDLPNDPLDIPSGDDERLEAPPERETD